MATRQGAARRYAARWPEAAATLLLAALLAHTQVSPYSVPLALAVAGGVAELPFSLFGALGSAAAAVAGGDPLLGLLCLAAPLGGTLGRRRLDLPRGVSGVLFATLLALPAAYLMAGGPLRYLVVPLTGLLALALAAAGAGVRSDAAAPRRLGSAALVVWATLGLAGASVYGVSLAGPAGLFAVLIAVRARVPAVPFAAILGLALALGGAASPEFALGLAAGTAISAYLRRYGAFHAWLGLAVGVVLPLGGTRTAAIEAVLTALLLLLAVSLLVPEAALRRLRIYFSPPAPQKEPAAPPDRLGEAVAQIDRLVRELGRESPPPAAEEADVAHLLGTVRERVCTDCPFEPVCWEEGFYQTYTGVRDLMLRHDNSPPSARDLPLDLRKRCPRPEQVATAVRLMGDQLRSDAGVRRLLHAERTLTRDALTGVRQMLAWALAEPEAPPAARLSFSSGLARVAKQRGGVSGDNYLVRELPDGRLLLGLSDGMGSGTSASDESATALELVEGFLSAGMEPVVALRAANVARRDARRDSFATLDLAIADLGGGELLSLKIGAPEAFLRRGGEVQVLHGDALPLGILPEASAAVQRLPLRSGDLLVLVSDGVLDSAPGPRGQWLEALLVTLDDQDPQYLAEAVLDAALGRRRDLRDDATVLVTSFHPPHQEPEIRAWVRRTRPEMGIVGGLAGQTAQRRRRHPRG